jgi:hypothetical protein
MRLGCSKHGTESFSRRDSGGATPVLLRTDHLAYFDVALEAVDELIGRERPDNWSEHERLPQCA